MLPGTPRSPPRPPGRTRIRGPRQACSFGAAHHGQLVAAAAGRRGETFEVRAVAAEHPELGRYLRDELTVVEDPHHRALRDDDAGVRDHERPVELGELFEGLADVRVGDVLGLFGVAL